MFDSLRDVEVELARIADTLAPVLAELAAVLPSSSATDAQLGRLNTALGTARDDLRTLRDGVGAVDVASYQFGDDAADRLGLWGWQVDTVSRLISIADQALQAQAVVSQLREGSRPSVYEVRSGETLQSIAQAVLGDWQEWTRLLEANGLDPAVVLQPGTVLVIPEKR